MLDWSDNTVFLLGGGPSLSSSLAILENNDRQDKKVIAINDTIYHAVNVDVLFFRDISWFYANRTIVDDRHGVVISSTYCDKYSNNVLVVKTKHSNDFLVGGDTIRYGRSSGHLALSLAISLGAERCVLLGYDC